MLKDAFDLESIIFEGNRNPYNSKDLTYLTKIGEDILQIGSVFDTYIDFIKERTIRVRLSEKEKYKYKYNPKLLSFDLYKTEELWSLILKLNNISSEIEFIPNSIYVVDPANKDILNKILLITEDDIKRNHYDYM